MKRTKRKRRSYAAEMSAEEREAVETAIRIRTRMRVRDPAGREKLFRSTVAEVHGDGEEDDSG